MKALGIRAWISGVMAFTLCACGEMPAGPSGEPSEVDTVSEALSFGNHGFAWVIVASGTWTVVTNYSWSSGSVPYPSVTHDGPGLYTVTFAGLNPAYAGPGNGGNVQVVATNQAGTGSIYANTRCKVANYGTPPTQQVSVACHDTTGAPADSPFIVHYVQADAATLGKSGYARTTGDPSSDAPYNPTATWSGNTTGGLNTIDRTGVGQYAVTLGGLAAPLCGVYPPCYGGNVQVTAFGAGSGSYCKISSFAPSGADEIVNVRCYSSTGVLADSHFSLNFDHRPSSQFGIGAHAWANDMTLASYAPDPAHSYNSDRGGFGTGTNLALRQQKGVFQMRHFGLENNKAAPFVTAYGADNLHCKIEKWGVVPGTVRDVQVETRCWMPTGGAPQDSRYLETFVSRRKPDYSDGDLDGFTPAAGDCNDGNASVYPGAPELCNGVDDDCDGTIDDGFDLDGDTYTTCGGDCNDGNPSVNPGAPELCNGVDDDCDTVIDEGFDVDVDTYTTCGGDCNDANPSVNPGATEVCNTIDDDCDAQIDEGGVCSTDPNLLIAFIGDQGNDANADAVLQLIENEGAAATVHNGDFDYVDNPIDWNNRINGILGPNYPYFAVVGNHDAAAWNGPSGYGSFIAARHASVPEMNCTGDLGVKSVCRFRGLHLVFSCVGTSELTGHGNCSKDSPEQVNFIRDSLASDHSTWSVCNWHKNQADMQVGTKGDEVGWNAYRECMNAGAIVSTGHEHSYSRTLALTDVGNRPAGHGAMGAFNTIQLAPGRTFVFVSGLGGNSVRNYDAASHNDDTWWASYYTGNRWLMNGVLQAGTATHGAFFVRFNVSGDPKRATAYFKDVNGRVADTFTIQVP